MATLERIDEDSREGFVLPSDEPIDDKGSGLHIGLTTDKNTRVNMPDNLGKRHTAIVGQSGVGKTTIGEYILWQQTARGGGGSSSMRRSTVIPVITSLTWRK